MINTASLKKLNLNNTILTTLQEGEQSELRTKLMEDDEFDFVFEHL